MPAILPSQSAVDSAKSGRPVSLTHQVESTITTFPKEAPSKPATTVAIRTPADPDFGATRWTKESVGKNATCQHAVGVARSVTGCELRTIKMSN